MKLFLFMMMLGIGVILFAATRTKSEAADKELEKTIELFMDEFERENESLLKTVKQLQQDLKNEIELQSKRIEIIEDQVQGLQQHNIAAAQQEQPEISPALVFNEHYSRVVEMDREGRTPEQISKETGIGLGEVQTVLNLAKQGNAV